MPKTFPAIRAELPEWGAHGQPVTDVDLDALTNIVLACPCWDGCSGCDKAKDLAAASRPTSQAGGGR